MGLTSCVRICITLRVHLVSCSILGVVPKDAAFLEVSQILHHYQHGAFYPIGGTSEIAHSFIPVIEQSGGRVLIRAPVKQILFNELGHAKGNFLKRYICCTFVIIAMLIMYEMGPSSASCLFTV